MKKRFLPHQSYDPSFYELLSQVEDRHFWFRARNQVIAAVVRRLTEGMPGGYRVLEIGCGTGNVLRLLRGICTGGTVVGMDLFLEGLRHARQRTDAMLVQGDMQTPPFKLSFDLIGLFDVLEHIPDDRQVLRDLYNLLPKGGRLLLTVPCHPFLWSYFDEAARHCRRYRQAELENHLIRTGYQVEYRTQYMASILPLVWFGRQLVSLMNRRPADATDRIHDLASRELRIIPVLNDLLAFWLAQEARLIACGLRFPVGTSLLVVARKK